MFETTHVRHPSEYGAEIPQSLIRPLKKHSKWHLINIKSHCACSKCGCCSQARYSRKRWKPRRDDFANISASQNATTTKQSTRHFSSSANRRHDQLSVWDFPRNSAFPSRPKPIAVHGNRFLVKKIEPPPAPSSPPGRLQGRAPAALGGERPRFGERTSPAGPALKSLPALEDRLPRAGARRDSRRQSRRCEGGRESAPAARWRFWSFGETRKVIR